MTLPDSDADPSSSTYNVQIGEGSKGIVIGNHAVVQQFYGVPAEPEVGLIAAEKRERFLRALLADHSSFMHGLLDNFVGREQELAEIRQRIAEKQQTGGYVTITGLAGQGKSSIIAKLVDIYQQEGGSEKLAFHFIPFNPGPDHQVGLLRKLMARLILKYNLSDLYVTSESRPALRDYFPKVLGELAAQGGQEVIFIDGLDQLEAEHSGERDLSFLPNNPPPGVVFVLSTRPNDTLKPLELLKPRYEYQLPVLSLEDFERILHHRNVQLERGLAGRFYAAMQGNALYLDLLAKELADQGTTDPEVLIKQVADNPDHLFSLTMTRLKRQPGEWREVIKPVLGVLLVAQEPLGVRHIRQILGVDDDRLRDGMERLGGLIIRDWQQRYSLFHLKLSEYLRQDEQRSDKEYIFASDVEEGWHKRVADWCEQGNLATIWEDVKHDAVEQQRRKYARQHYMTHLYRANEWQRLFEVLDTVQYGKARIDDDPSMRSYAQDLDLGRQAASWEGWTLEEGMALLPRLWRYTLLRSSLNGRADQYPLAVFQLLILLNRKQEAAGLAELLTDSARKVQALLQIAEQLRGQSDQEKEWLALLHRAGEIARTIKDSKERAEALAHLGSALAQAQQWEQAHAVIGTIENIPRRAEALVDLGSALAQAQQWEQAHAVIGTIEDSYNRAKALGDLAREMAQAQQWEQAHAVIGTIEDSYNRAWALAHLAREMAQAQQWEQAQAIIGRIKESSRRAWALAHLAGEMAQAQQWEQAHAVWKRAQAVISTIEERYEYDSYDYEYQASYNRAEALAHLAGRMAQAQQWEQAQAVINTIEDSYNRAKALVDLGTALAQAQQWEQAHAVIGTIEDSSLRAKALGDLAREMAQAQQWEQAQAIIGRIKESSRRAWALAHLAGEMAQAQQWEQAHAVIGMIEESSRRAEALAHLGTALAQAQQWEQAHAVWKQVQAVIGTIKDSYNRAEALAHLGSALAQAQQWEQAQAVWAQAQAVISTIEDSYNRARALAHLGSALAQQWEQAHAVIGTIENIPRRAEALAHLAGEMAQAQQWGQAQVGIAMKDVSAERAKALVDLARKMADAGEYEALLHVIHHSWRLVDKRKHTLDLFPMAICFIPHNPELGLALHDAFSWVDNFFLKR
jgi:tetratricopeptide (TPR) repeat protein